MAPVGASGLSPLLALCLKGLAQRFPPPGLGRQGHISPADLTRFAHSQAALQDQLQQGFVPLNRAQPSADWGGHRFAIPPPSG